MIIIWYSDPSKGDFARYPQKFSSFYQYEPVTKQFVRIRLELGRGGTDGGRTFANYKDERAVGFSGDRLSTGDLTKWSVNDSGKLCFNDVALEQTPTKNYQVYDSSDVSSSVHRGNPVTDTPNFPEGIESKHLSLIANDVLIRGENVALTDGLVGEGGAGARALSDALKNRVSKILDNKPFAQITDADILNKLKVQVTTIKNKVLKVSENAMDEAMEEVDSLVENINEKMEEGTFTPNRDVTKAFDALTKSIKEAKTSVEERTDIQENISKLKEARNALKDAIRSMDAREANQFRDALRSSGKAMENAHEASREWESVQEEYERTENAESIEEYEESIGGVEVED